MTAIRQFTQDGIERFRAFVEVARSMSQGGEVAPEVPAELLESDAFSSPTDFELPADRQNLTDKMGIGAYFCRVFPESEHHKVRLDAAMWSWLAAKFFDQLTDGRRKIKEPRAYVASIGYQHFYRHLLLGPYYIFFSAQDHPERVRVLLYDDPTTMNEVMVQFGSYQTLMQNPALQRVVQTLYFDSRTGRIKRGAGGKVRGAPRRLMDFLRQIELNYDLASITDARIFEMLPAEFSRFQDHSREGAG